MNSRTRNRALAAVIALVLLGVAIFVFLEWRGSRSTPAGGEGQVTAASAGEFDDQPRIVFRNTASGETFGEVAVVSLDDPQGPREFTDIACDRVHATHSQAICLRTERGVLPRFTAIAYDDSWQESVQWPLAGLPSRTRLSADGTLVATTTFVSGHSYATSGFSTETAIHRLDGANPPEDLGNIEFYRLIVDGSQIAPVDRNLWGVTFVDDTTFYATAQSVALGKTWLVRGNLDDQTLEAIAEGVECPSISPDRTRIAFKATTSTEGGVHWTPAVLDLDTLKVTVLGGEKTSIDDQIEWLDDDTILYGLPRADQAGVTDVWALQTRDGAEPQLFLPEAWSPAVIR